MQRQERGKWKEERFISLASGQGTGRDERLLTGPRELLEAVANAETGRALAQSTI